MEHKVVFCFHTNDHEYNLGIGFISSYLKENGVDVELVIYREIEGKQMDSPDYVVGEIMSKKPTIVAFSVMTFNWHRIRQILSMLREAQYDGLIVVGGYHAVLDCEDVLEQSEVDVVCTGEGERPMLDLVTQYDGSNISELSIDGMIINSNKQKLTRPEPWLSIDLDEYPYMDYDLFAEEGEGGLKNKFIGTFSIGGVYSLALITGRGCPYRCSYCSNSVLIDYYGGSKKFLRRYSVENAVSHIKKAVDRHKPEFIEFMDETFTNNKTWINEFCALYKKEVGLPFSIMNRIDNLTTDLVQLLVDTGLKVVMFGLESGDEDYRARHLNRKMSNEAIIQGAKLLKSYGVMILTFNMFGMPFETQENIRKTFLLNEKVDPEVAIPFVYQVFPKTALGKVAIEHGMAPSVIKGRWDYCTPSLDTKDLPADKVANLVDEFRERFCNQNKVENFYESLRQHCHKAIG